MPQIKAREYEPLPRIASNNLLRRWATYRDAIGLEGTLVLKLRSRGASDEEIAASLEQHRKLREQLLPTFHAQIGLIDDE